MNELWIEASNKIDVEIETDNEISYLYLGFKITKTKENEIITLYNIRISDFYNEVQGSLLKRFLQNGFEKTCDELQIERDNRRVVLVEWHISKSIVNQEDKKTKKLQKLRFDLLSKINKLKEKTYES